MTERNADPFASGRESLRETVKWLVGLASGFGAALAAGISFTAIAALEGRELQHAVAAGLVAVLVVMLSVGELLRVMLVKPFTTGTLTANSALKRKIAESSVLPYNIASFDALLSAKNSYASQVAASPGDATATQNLAAASEAVGRALSLASFYDLSDRVTRALSFLAIASAILLVAIGYVGYLLGEATKVGPGPIETMFSPGEGWTAVAAALQEACGDGPLPVTATTTGTPGWFNATILGPAPCGGAQFSVPRALLTVAPDPG
jgi:hypothetical protein